jgi:hypothetical protein
MKSGKQFTILSDNPKMDTSGMAGKPRPMPTFEWKPPVMTIKDIMEVHENKTNKKPETE